MPSKAFYCKLVAPRPSFAQDMSPAEAQAMQDHGVYWRNQMGTGRVVVFGLVADPTAAFGVIILEVPDAEAARRLTANDPAIQAGFGLRYEIHPMPLGATYPSKGAA